jgi:hypothetical protein
MRTIFQSGSCVTRMSGATSGNALHTPDIGPAGLHPGYRNNA